MRIKLIPIFFLALSFQMYAAVTIAINKLSTTGVTEGEAISLTDALRSELGKTGKYQVMERSQMEEILKEQGFQQSGACDETSCAIKIGRILAVNYMVMGNIGMVGKTYTLSARLVEVGTGKILKDFTEYHKGSPDELLTLIIPKLANKIAGTYKTKMNNAVWWVTGGLVAAAIAVPVVLLNRKPGGSDPTSSSITIQWNQ